MDSIVLKAAESCRWDCVSLGEVMLRLDPGEERIHTARTFRAWEGGGEYNVARGLRRCFGMRTAVITAFAKNPIGQLLEDLILQGGVDTSLIRWVPYDGIGRTVRNGLNFTERGFGVRAAVGCSDRGNTAIAQQSAERFRLANKFSPTAVLAGCTPAAFLRLFLLRPRRSRRRQFKRPAPRAQSFPTISIIANRYGKE